MKPERKAVGLSHFFVICHGRVALHEAHTNGLRHIFHLFGRPITIALFLRSPKCCPVLYNVWQFQPFLQFGHSHVFCPSICLPKQANYRHVKVINHYNKALQMLHYGIKFENIFPGSIPPQSPLAGSRFGVLPLFILLFRALRE